MSGPVGVATAFAPGPSEGVPGHLTTLGSGLAIPGGLECAFEYRGLILNVRGTPERYRLSSIDGLMDADIRDTRDPNTNSDGETPYNAFYGGRTVVLNGTILAYSIPKLRDMTQALRSAFSDIGNEYPLIFRTGTFAHDHMIYCKKISAINMTEQQQNQDIRRDFQISLRASYPCFLGYYQKTIDVSNAGNVDGGWTLLGNATNIGNYKALPVFRIHGPFASVTIRNDANGQSFTLGPVGVGDYLEFGTGGPPAFRKYLVNSWGEPAWDLMDDSSQYLTLNGASIDGSPDGSNNILCQCKSIAVRVQMWWRDTAI